MDVNNILNKQAEKHKLKQAEKKQENKNKKKILIDKQAEKHKLCINIDNVFFYV